jgi:penicillin-binding protein 1A
MSRFLTKTIYNFKLKQGKIYSTLIIALWSAFFVGVLAVVLFVYSVNNNFMGLYGGFPSYEMLENPEAENLLASELYSSDGVLMGKYFRENRSYVDFDELSPNLVNALLATEDVRFSNHSGIDLKAIIRAVFGKMTFSFKGGGSTLTQQLAENVFFNRSEYFRGKLHETKLGPYVDKIKEWIVAVKLERDYTKKEIMAMYLNTMEFGSNAFGIQVASKTFFNKTPAELNLQEAAVLVGMLQAPTRLSPVFNYDNSLRRRNTVLSQMHKYGFLSSYQSDSLRSMPIELDYNVESHNEGMATYFRSVIRGFLLDWCREQNIDLFSSGLRIYTTIDSRMQQYAEEAVQTKMSALQQRFENHWKGRNPWIDESGREIKDFLERQLARTDHYRRLVREFGRNADTINVILNTPRRMKVFTYNGEIDTLLSPIDSLKYYKRFLQTGFMAMDPHSGDIKAWVGGINHSYFKFDHVMQREKAAGFDFQTCGVYRRNRQLFFSLLSSD